MASLPAITELEKTFAYNVLPLVLSAKWLNLIADKVRVFKVLVKG